MTTTPEAGVNTTYCGKCGEWISVEIFDPEVETGDEDPGVWIAVKHSPKGRGVTYRNGEAFHGMICDGIGEAR